MHFNVKYVEMETKSNSATEQGSIKPLRTMSIGLLTISIVLIAIITVAMYWFTQNLLQERLNERVYAIVSTSALLIDSAELSQVLDAGPIESLKMPEYKTLVKNLRAIKNANKNITFAYILKPTEDPAVTTFVADADVIALMPNLNFNEDEVTDEGFPGSEYDVSEISVIQNGAAYLAPTINPDVYEDYWGTLYTGFAPLKDVSGKTLAILAIDLDITDYNRLVKATFLPFGILTIILMLLSSGMGVALLKMWGGKVDLLRELDKQKDELLSIVSHQLATPISSAKWYVEMLLDGDMGELTPTQTESIKTLQPILSNLTDLVSMILDVSRIQLGRMKVDRAELNLKDFFDEVITVIMPKANDKEIQLTKEFPENLPVALLDKRLMRMTLENLLSNAVKYTPENGKVLLKVEIQNGNLNYSVTDTGFGIPKADQSKIFGKLYRASNVQKVDGNGFGLFAAKGAVEALGGSITFKSEEGKGTSFAVTIPIDSKSTNHKLTN